MEVLLSEKISTICVKIFPNPLTHENRKTLLNTSILDLIAWNEYFSIGRLSLKFNRSQTLFFSFDIDDTYEKKDAFHKETEHIAIPSDQFVEHLSSKSKMMLKYLRSLIFEFFFISQWIEWYVACITKDRLIRICTCTSHQSDCCIRVFFYLGPIISQYLDILYQLQRWGIAFLLMISCKKGATHKERHRPNILGSFGKCNGLWPSREPRRLRSRFIGIRKVSR